MEITIKNQLNGTIDLCAGMQEHRIEPEAEVTVEIPDGDYIYLDQVTKPISYQLTEKAGALDDKSPA